MGFSACVVDETDFPSELDGILDWTYLAHPSAQVTLPEGLIWLDEEGHVAPTVNSTQTNSYMREIKK